MNLERLFFLREQNDLKQIDMAKVLGVKQVNISKWETMKEIIPLKKLNLYSNYFNVSLNYIMKFIKIKKQSRILETIDKKIVGKRIREFRIKNNITQEDLAKFLNTTHSTISAYENGKTLILTSFAYQICAYYNISFDWLCGKE